MKHLPSRSPLLFRLLAAGSIVTLFSPGWNPRAGFLASAAAQTATGSPAPAATAPVGQPSADTPANAGAPATGMAYTDAKGRHLAPHGTFYLLSYVSATTDKGVEGFDPGQEVHVVAVHRDTHTLVVSDGHAQVEVPPSKLTNDLDIAALVREKDQAKQGRIAAYIQSEQAAYDKAEQQAADATAKDLQHRQQAQAADVRAAEQASAQQTTAPVEAADLGNGYYDQGGFGYGSPYEYLVDGGGRARPETHETAPAAAPARTGVVTAPVGGGRPK